jgi:hypothetical protein
MKRTDTIFKTVVTTAVAVAITAGPAFASTGDASPSPNSWGTSSAAQTSDYTSINASLNGPAPVVATTGHSSINASLSRPGSVVAASGHSSVLASVNEPSAVTPVPAGSTVSSIVGARQTAPVETATVVHENGFDWTDAFIGAMGALTLALLSVATVHTLRRRERVSLGSRV